MGIAPTGKPAELSICDVRELKNGRVQPERGSFDFLHALGRLGLVSPPGA